MAWPQATDYADAVQNPKVTFRDPDIRDGQAVTSALGLPLTRIGNFAAVFHVRSAKGQQDWAVKCFTRHVSGLQWRYYQIDAHLREQRRRLPAVVRFQYIPESLLIGGNWYPFLKMNWVEGLRLDEFLAACLAKSNYKSLLRVLTVLWLRLACTLNDAKIGHADLQHGNVLLVKDPRKGKYYLRLVDYDGMYVPALASEPPNELGHAAYQHPGREADRGYGPDVDRFSHLLIYTTLHCLISGGHELWDQYYDGDRLLIGPRDLADPSDSPIFQELWRVPEPAVRNLIGHLVLATSGDIEDVPPLDDLVDGEQILPLTTLQQRQVDKLLTGTTLSGAQNDIAPETDQRPPQPTSTATPAARSGTPTDTVDVDQVSDAAWYVGDAATNRVESQTGAKVQGDPDNRSVYEARIVYEWMSCGFVADCVVPNDRLATPDHLVVQLQHQVLGNSPVLVSVRLSETPIEPVQYLRLANFIERWPLTLRLYYPARLPKLELLLNAPQSEQPIPFRTRQSENKVAAVDSVGCHVGRQYYELIAAGAELPCVMTRPFATTRANQTVISVQPVIKQADGKEITLPQIRAAVPPAPAGVASYRYLFRVDPDGRFTIIARNPLRQLRIEDLLIVPPPRI